jgi:hypothetical protein
VIFRHDGIEIARFPVSIEMPTILTTKLFGNTAAIE